jgi:hypothetical protein
MTVEKDPRPHERAGSLRVRNSAQALQISYVGYMTGRWRT